VQALARASKLEPVNVHLITGEQEALTLATEEARRPFDLTRGPLLRVTLLRLAQDEYTFLLTMHHIVSDEWSLIVFVRELTVFYEAFSTGKSSPMPELPIQYADFAIWQQEWSRWEGLVKQVSYRKQQLGGSLTVLDLPIKLKRQEL
jgi:hypothetical protein